jgi:ribonuclease HII
MLKCRQGQDELIEVGVDEAGRGCLWGPLYAGAVIWPPEEEMTEEQASLAPLIKDSKKLTAKRRTALAELIKDNALSWAVGSVSPAEIDQLGMTKANQLAFRRALEGLSVEPDRLIIDGILSLFDMPWALKDQVVEPEADNRYLPVAAASILAKTEHDEWVKQFCDINQNIAERYDFASNKGYGTAKHRAGILTWGEHELHRKLFLRKLWAGRETEDAQELKFGHGSQKEDV